jgi:hypothetical protein
MQAIDQALRAQRWPTDKTLATDLEVDPRTIRRDLEFMRDEHHAPIAFDRARRGYHPAKLPKPPFRWFCRFCQSSPRASEFSGFCG